MWFLLLIIVVIWLISKANATKNSAKTKQETPSAVGDLPGTWFCLRCGYKNSPGFTVCGGCGASAPEKGTKPSTPNGRVNASAQSTPYSRVTGDSAGPAAEAPARPSVPNGRVNASVQSTPYSRVTGDGIRPAAEASARVSTPNGRVNASVQSTPYSRVTGDGARPAAEAPARPSALNARVNASAQSTPHSHTEGDGARVAAAVPAQEEKEQKPPQLSKDTAARMPAGGTNTEKKPDPAEARNEVPVQTVTFGEYKQGVNGEIAPVEWQVLETAGKRALLISRRALFTARFNGDWGSRWDKSTLRTMLNGEFLNECFSAEDREAVLTADVVTEKSPDWGTEAGDAVRDKVFLLSLAETERYFTSDGGRVCVPTPYAAAQGCRCDGSPRADGQKPCFWRLRSPGFSYVDAAVVRGDGRIDTFGADVTDGTYGVRPALWVEIE